MSKISEMSEEELLDFIWSYPDHPENVFIDLALMELERKYLQDLYEKKSVNIGEFSLTEDFKEDDTFYILSKSDKSKTYDSDWLLLKGFHGIRDFISRKIGDTLTKEDILDFMNSIAKVETENGCYSISNSEYIVSYNQKNNNLFQNELFIHHGILSVTMKIDSENKILSIETSHDPIFIEQCENWAKYHQNAVFSSNVDCVITGDPDDLSVILFIDYDCFLESGILIFGNEGDLTIPNAIYHDERKTSPYYNKGWMLTGYIDFSDNKYKWIPLDNDFSDNEEWFDEWIESWELTQSKEELLELKKNFILEHIVSIKVKLMELGIEFDEIIEY